MNDSGYLIDKHVVEAAVEMAVAELVGFDELGSPMLGGQPE